MIYTDGLTLDSFVTDGPYRSQRPFLELGLNDVYLIEQDFIAGKDYLDDNWPLPLASGQPTDIAHPIKSDFKLCAATDPEPLDGGFYRVTLTYAKLPPSVEEIVSPYNYTYPGIVYWQLLWRKFCDKSSEIGDPNNPPPPPDANNEDRCEWRLVLEPYIYREPKALDVESKIVHEWFLATDPPPIIESQKWTQPAGTWLIGPWGIILIPHPLLQYTFSDYLHAGAILNPSTNPTVAEYTTWVTNGTWFAAETSVIERWKGNFWHRKTRYVKAR